MPNDPQPIGSKKIIGTEHTYRQSIDDYRILYSIENCQLVIGIVRVAPLPQHRT
ncbi:MAG: type II toxin-antitoxin system RelE/ParE family toxin [Sedimenticola sp.]